MGLGLQNRHGTISSGSIDAILAPSSGYQRANLYASFTNKDSTATVKMSFNLVDGTDTVTLKSYTLGPGETAKFEEHLVLDATTKKMTISITEGTPSTPAEWQANYMELL